MTDRSARRFDFSSRSCLRRCREGTCSLAAHPGLNPNLQYPPFSKRKKDYELPRHATFPGL
eukprot:scaffold1282_cov251-Pinguiococcus_pyrenoidosus.AAC.43